MRVLAISGGMSAESSTGKLTDRLLAELAQSAGASTSGRGVFGGVEPIIGERLDLRPLGHDLVNMVTTGMASPALEAALDRVSAADGLILAAPVYNAAPVGLFTLFLQLLPQRALAGKPVLLAGTGGSVRHSMVFDGQVRPLIAYLKGLALPTVVFAATEDWGAPESRSGLSHRVQSAAGELRAALEAGGRVPTEPGLDGASRTGGFGRQSGVLVDEFDPMEVTPFEQLLNG
jgi:FMN reductase